jgi:hypothetical protein
MIDNFQYANLDKISELQASRDKNVNKLPRKVRNQGSHTLNPILFRALSHNIFVSLGRADNSM